jgi:type II secretory pathway predicted ATPase ExeA
MTEPGEDDIDLSLTEESKPASEPPEQLAQPPEQPVFVPLTPESRKMGVAEWLQAMRWRTNPFVFSIVPSLFVGYRSQTERIMNAIEERHKLLLILGPTGSGKTTILKWLSVKLRHADALYIGKPPKNAEDFVEIFNAKYRKPWYAFWKSKIKTIYELPDFLNKKTRGRPLVLLFDEAHEANTEVLEWLRTLNDQVESMTVVLSGLPDFEDQLRNNLETFTKRITAKISLLSLTKEETKELITKRIVHAGGRGDEFPDFVIDKIYDYTAGFPREIIRVCDELVNNAMSKGRTQIEFDLHEKKEAIEEARPVSMSLLEKMTPMQKEILEMLSKKAMTPGQIANSLDLAKYKSRQHAVRSLNNVMKSLLEDGYLERQKEEKAYLYSLSPKISTLFVKR